MAHSNSSSLVGDLACPLPPMHAFGRNQIRISKSEIRNKSEAQMLQCSKRKSKGPWFRSFEFGSLDIVSDFVLRILDFQLLSK